MLDSLNLPELQHIHLWHIKFNLLEHDSRITTSLLNDDEQAKYKRFKIEHAKQQFLFSHAATRLILSRYLGTPAAEIKFIKNTHGKPFLASNNTLKFNLSHTKDYGLLGITRQLDIGVDVENMKKMHEWQGISKRFFHPLEFEQLDRVTNTLQESTFFTFWTRKEAFIKALGTGLHTPLTSFTVLDNEDKMVMPAKANTNNKNQHASAGETEKKDQQPANWAEHYGNCWYFADIEIPEPCKAAVVLADKIKNIEHYNF